MAKLVEIEGYRPGREIEIAEALLIGRDPGAHGLVIANKEASRLHARIVRDGLTYRLEDLNSANGTLVNGTEVRRAVLTEGARITIGRTTLRFTLDPVAESSGSREKPVLDPWRPSPPTPEGGNAQPSPPIKSPREALRVSISTRAGSSYSPERSNTAVWKFTLDAHSSRLGYDKDVTPPQLQRQHDVLEILCDISRTLGSILQLPVLVQQVLLRLFELFPVAESASVHLLEGERLVPLGARSRAGGALNPPPLSQTITQMAIQDRQSILSSDAAEDDRFLDKQSIILHKVRSFMCSPLLFRDEVLGVLYVDTTDALPRFSPDDLTLFTAVSAQIAVAVKNSQLMEQSVREAALRAHLSRYLPPELVEQVMHQQIELTPGGSLVEGTILFTDIVGFTPMAERMSPHGLVQSVNAYFEVMLEAIFRHGGSINRFGGDSILAMWGVPLSHPDATLRAVLCALEMQGLVFAFNLRHHDEDASPLRVAMGLNTGHFVVGNIGSDRHMEYTALGAAVNLAQRIESRATGGQVLIARSTLEAIRPLVSVFALRETPLKGVAAPVPLFSVRAASEEDGRWRCAVPAFLSHPAAPHAEVLLIQIEADRLTLLSPSRLVPGSKVTLALSPPEYPGIGRVTGQVVLSQLLEPEQPEMQGARMTIEMDSPMTAFWPLPSLLRPAPGQDYQERR